MMHEVRSIPPAPRRVRLRPLLAHRWPLLLVGTVLCVVGGLWTWMLFLAAGAKPSDQALLDLGRTATTTGTVTRIEPAVEWDGARWERVHYSFRWRDRDLSGASFVPAGGCRQDAPVAIELLPEESNRNRVVGSRLHFPRPWLSPAAWLTYVVVPGALALLAWLAGVFRLRHVLVHGDVSVGTPTAVARVAFVLPEMLCVEYRFRDHRAVERRGRHWVRAHGALGERLVHAHRRGTHEPLPVLHDRRLPSWNRLVVAQDFLAQPPGGTPEPQVTV